MAVSQRVASMRPGPIRPGNIEAAVNWNDASGLLQ